MGLKNKEDLGMSYGTLCGGGGHKGKHDKPCFYFGEGCILGFYVGGMPHVPKM